MIGPRALLRAPRSIPPYFTMRFIADLHLHSRYSRATSQEMEVKTLALWGKRKGVKLLGTGDFTHPVYLRDLISKLNPLGNGLFSLKDEPEGTHFLLTAEVSNMYSQGGRSRRVHTLIFAPSFQVVERINARLEKYGKIASDGRPIFGFSAKDLLKMVLDISPECMIVPAHAWTPWFSILGARSGFDSILECYEEEAKHIRAIETGLSSDPEMNWRLSALDEIALISNSDAHSPGKIGREANIFQCELSYLAVTGAIRKKDPRKFLCYHRIFSTGGKIPPRRSPEMRSSPVVQRSPGMQRPLPGMRETPDRRSDEPGRGAGRQARGCRPEEGHPLRARRPPGRDHRGCLWSGSECLIG